MCDPTGISYATLAIAIASAATGYVAQDQQATAQTNYAERARDAAREKAANDFAALGLRQSQEQAAAAEKDIQAQRQGEANAATSLVSGLEAGAAGNSFADTVSNILGRENAARAQAAAQRDMTVSQLEAEKLGVADGTQATLNSARNGTAPSMVGLGLEIGGAALKSYDTYDRYQYRQTAGTKTHTRTP
jgi:hypothetical protein